MTMTKKRGVGDAAVEAIKSGKNNEEALVAVHSEFPKAKTSLASIGWYRGKLRRGGDKSIKTSRELKAKAKS